MTIVGDTFTLQPIMSKTLILLCFILALASVGCEEARLPLNIDSPAEDGVLILPGSPQYDEIQAYLEEIEASKVDGEYVLNHVEYAKVLSMLPTPTPEQERRRELWREQFDHWENLDAMDARMEAIYVDKVVDLEESVFMCSVSSQWLAQLHAAQTYVAEFTEFAPDMVEANGDIIPNLARAAEEREAILMPAIEACDG